MASYQYTVTGIDPPMSSSEQAPDDHTARQQAVLFLSDLLRDLAISKRDGSEIRVEVRGSEGDLICVATAQIVSEPA
ncbi:DUF6894 family protein [Brevundimonas bacteroides]|uniref:DUF6894 family protein n=1 Tax=Brevundimonas bacteroides TaxID=74311 RepID=UPI00387E18DA